MAELSGLEVLELIREINSGLRGTYVNNIYSEGEAQVFRLRGTNGDVWLLASPDYGMWVSEKASERTETTEFTSKLRGHLERAKFLGASQIDLDRVYELSFGNIGPDRKFILELMPPGNLIVTDGAGEILDALRELRSARRRVARGTPYIPPARGRVSPSLAEPGDVERAAAGEKTAGTAIGRHFALPKKYVSEVLFRLSLTEGSPAASLAGRGQEAARVMRGIVAEAEDAPAPCVCRTPVGEEVFAIRPRGFPPGREARTISALCDELFLSLVADRSKGAPGPDETRAAELQRTLEKLREQERELVGRAARMRASAARAAVAGSMAEALDLLKEEGVRNTEDPGSTAAAASVLYDGAKELEVKASEAAAAAKRLERKVPRAKAEGAARKTLPRRKAEWYEKFRWFRTTEGKLAIGGRDAQSNALLVKRHLGEGDTVYHADLFGSPFFVLKEGAGQTESEVREVAQATVAFSSAWKTGLGAADAYWVGPGQVSQAAPSGEFLPRGSFVIRGKKNFVNNNLVEIAIGVDGGGRVMAGPELSIRETASCYVVVRPHREKASDTAKRVLRELDSMADESRGKLSLDDVLRALPPGGGKVLRRGRTGSPSGPP